MAKPGRKPTDADSDPLVRMSVPLHFSHHAKLCGLAGLRRIDRSQLAMEFIVQGLKRNKLDDSDFGASYEPESPAA